MKSIVMEMELVSFGRAYTGKYKNSVRMLKNKKGIYNKVYISSDLAESFENHARMNLMAMPDGSMFKLVKSNTGLITFTKNHGLYATSQALCGEIIARTVKGYGTEIATFKAHINKDGEIVFVPDL